MVYHIYNSLKEEKLATQALLFFPSCWVVAGVLREAELPGRRTGFISWTALSLLGVLLRTSRWQTLNQTQDVEMSATWKGVALKI